MSTAVEVVERQLQVLAVLRAAEGLPVPRAELVQKVPAYALLTDSFQALKKLMQNDAKALVDLGFAVEDTASVGEESAFVLRPQPYDLPVDLDPFEQGLLVWVTAAAGATAQQDATVTDLSDLLGVVPRSLDLVQTALSTGRALRVLRNGDERVFEPGLLVARHGTWFVIGRYAGFAQLYGPRLDRFDVLGLGAPLTGPVEVGDPDEVLDATAWPEHSAHDAELRCATADLGGVLSWFPRAHVTQEGAESVLRFWYRNELALVTRVIGLAGVVRIVAPPSARAAVVVRAQALLEQASS